MENLYEVLQSDHGASTEDLKKSYTRLIRLYHPDKNIQTAVVGDNSRLTDNAEKFIQIDRAWKILSDPQLRAKFDAKWHEHNVVKDLPVQDIVPLEDFDYDDKDHVYSYPCRCGSDYLLSEMDCQLHFDFVCCETCSLTIKVVYK